MYGNTYWKCLGALLIFAAVFFVLGLLLYKPVSKPLELMEKTRRIVK
jgi:ABC-type multidrug transport system permease subunit